MVAELLVAERVSQSLQLALWPSLSAAVVEMVEISRGMPSGGSSGEPTQCAKLSRELAGAPNKSLPGLSLVAGGLVVCT